MVKQGSKHYQELDFTHFVMVTSDGTIFGCAKKDGRIYNFLIRRDKVHTQCGESWQELEEHIADIVRNRARAAYKLVPTFKTDSLPVKRAV